MRLFGWYIAWRVLRGSRTPERRSPDTLFAFLFSGIVCFILFAIPTALFIAKGPIFLAVPLAGCTILVVVLTITSIVGLPKNGKQNK